MWEMRLVGAYNSDGKSIDSGKAYVFRWNGSSWVQEQMLFASDGATDDGFGGSVTISGDMVLVGASEEEKGVPGSGMVYYFRWNDTTSLWEQKQKLLPSDGAAGDQFGQSVSISGEVALVGAEQIEFVPGKGKAYVFRWNGSSWVEKQKLFASDGAVGDRFGYSVSISGDVALVGAGGDDDKGSGSGSAYIYTPIDPCECDFDGDRDVDGLDLEAYISDQAGINLADCAGDLGRVDCPE